MVAISGIRRKLFALVVAVAAAAPVTALAVTNNGGGVWLGAGKGGQQHLVTGFICPAALGGGWTLESTTEFGRPWDVSCNYDSDAGRLSLHAYHPRGMNQAEEVRSTSRMIIQRATGGAQLVETAESLPVAGGALSGVRIEGRPPGGPVAAVSLFDRDGWRLKVRETTTDPARAASAVAEFFGAQTALVRQFANCAAWERASGREARLLRGDAAPQQAFVEATLIGATLVPPEGTTPANTGPEQPVLSADDGCTVAIAGSLNQERLLLRGRSGDFMLSIETAGATPRSLGSVRKATDLDQRAGDVFLLTTENPANQFNIHRFYRRRPANDQAITDMLAALSGRLSPPVVVSANDGPEPGVSIGVTGAEF